MAAGYLDVDGLVISSSALTLRRAREVVLAIEVREDSYARVVECRKSQGTETVVLDVEPERPQSLAADIRRTERVALVFSESDRACPEVLSLRPDFPLTPHLNLTGVEYPRSLCLYDQPWPEIRVNWTAPAFIERIRWWFRGTARGDLHAEDQPLEPLLLAPEVWLVLPGNLPEPMTPCVVALVGDKRSKVLLASGSVVGSQATDDPAATHMLLRFVTPPRMHGICTRIPATLEDLCTLLRTTEFDLCANLRSVFKNWPRDREKDLAAKIVLLIDLPKVRAPSSSVVAVERKAFLTRVNGLELGAAVGAWEMQNGRRAVILKPDESARGQSVDIITANVTNQLTPVQAASLNGEERSNRVTITAIGAGTLGSQVILNLARAGFGQWTIIDNDRILPHNLARHILDGVALGWNKAIAVTGVINGLMEAPIAQSIDADVLDAGEEASRIEAALTGAEILLDFSASVAVARHLASVSTSGRRMSVFLSPSGHDLVLLCEDDQRQIRLDQLEMSYYAAVAFDERLDGHLNHPPERTRYGLSCRDVSSTIAQADVATLAGIAARAIPVSTGISEATIRIWRLSPETGAVQVVEIMPDRWVTQRQNGWTAHIACSVLTQMAEWRGQRLPNETGGILLGGIDHDRRMLYVSRALRSPPDSVEWPTMYTRGSHGTLREAERVLAGTQSNMVYVGEWHSHPKGHPTLPSPDDVRVLATVADWLRPAGQPGLIMIAGDGQRARVFLGSYDRSHPPEELWAA